MFPLYKETKVLAHRVSEGEVALGVGERVDAEDVEVGGGDDAAVPLDGRDRLLARPLHLQVHPRREPVHPLRGLRAK